MSQLMNNNILMMSKIQKKHVIVYIMSYQCIYLVHVYISIHFYKCMLKAKMYVKLLVDL